MTEHAAEESGLGADSVARAKSHLDRTHLSSDLVTARKLDISKFQMTTNNYN